METSKNTKNHEDSGSNIAIILVSPQMGENIGAAARAMLNCGLTDLRIVNPRDGWPSEPARAMSSGALEKMPPVQVFDTVADAVADCHHVYATTARTRDMVKRSFTARSAAQDIEEKQKKEPDYQAGILFGGERAGLSNDDVALAHSVITIPLNPDFSSLNLAQAVLLVSYEIAQLQNTGEDMKLLTGKSELATHEEINGFLKRLEEELDTHSFFRTEEMKPTTLRNLQSLFLRADLTDQEVRTLHGIVSALIGKNS